jgi:F0F1-type ATP synthase assembly protein I
MGVFKATIVSAFVALLVSITTTVYLGMLDDPNASTTGLIIGTIVGLCLAAIITKAK